MQSRPALICTIPLAAVTAIPWLLATTASSGAAAPQVAERPPPAGQTPLAGEGLRTRHPSRTFLPRLPRVGLVAPGSPFAHLDERQVVRHVYDRFSRYSESVAGDRVELALGDFRTVYAPDLGAVALYPDLATLGTDWRLATTSSVQQRPDGGAHVRYDVAWLPSENLADRSDTAEFLGRPADEMTRLAARRLAGDRARTLAITSYQVTATFGGQSETYRAAFRWFLGGDRVIRFSIVDAVVHGLNLALAETVAPAGPGGASDEAEPVTATNEAADAQANVCAEQVWPARASRPKKQADDSDHLSGEHSSLFAVSVECSCDAACVSRCEPSVVTAVCEDVGRLEKPGMVHRAQGRTSAAAARTRRGDEEAASCLAALDCYTERCLGAECGEVEITPQSAAPGIRFSLAIDMVISYHSAHNHRCGRCAAR